jgi:hypothetical protein
MPTICLIVSFVYNQWQKEPKEFRIYPDQESHSRATAHYTLRQKSRRYMSNGLYAPNEKTEFRAKIKVIVLYLM